MKSRTWMWITAVYLFVLVMPVSMTAQDNPSQDHKPKHHTYKLIDMGTLGGPNGYLAIDNGVNGAPNQVVEQPGRSSRLGGHFHARSQPCLVLQPRLLRFPRIQMERAVLASYHSARAF